MAPPWLDLLDDTIRACATSRRDDLVDRLLGRRAGLLAPGRRVVLAGRPGTGKSHLVNALLGAEICATGDDVTTTIPTVIRHATHPSATLVSPVPLTESTTEGTFGPAITEWSITAPTRLALAPAAGHGNNADLGANGHAAPGHSGHAPADASHNGFAASTDAVPGLGGRGPEDEVARAEIGLPRALLQAGLVVVDSPGFVGPGCPRTERAMDAVAEADAVLVVTAATAELTPVELDLVAQVGRLCPTVLVALTKTDLCPDWRQVAAANRIRLAEVGVSAPVVPVSSALRAAAVRTGDQALNEESGFAELIGHLRTHVLADPVRVAARAAAATSGMAVDQLIAPLRAEVVAEPDPARERATAEWHAAARRIERLRREGARWQTRLGDDVADLVADLDFDLRERTRRILREVDDYFDSVDPGKVWSEFSEWLPASLTEVAEVHAGWLLDRFEWIAARVAGQVVPGAAALPGEFARDLAAEHTEALRRPNIELFSPVQKAFVGLRGSYSGLLMSGLATTLAGLPLINPISLGAGVAFGARSVFEERGARLKRRQAVAKTAAQRYVDDFFLRYGKESKDATRQIHRALRDRFSEYAEEMRTAADESAREIKRALDADTTRRAHQRAELERLLALRTRIEAVRGRPA
ncbi:dynamin family protein [Actinokineospora enzanensis]|uniref:dynamin family protein n=1 Tax=Actinokineospora enzanensis TaxID=155975 RepID=UPI00037BF539|nr:dynamin family protein [Actinokineospora enzanensis]